MVDQGTSDNVARLEVRIRTPREQPNIERLREALNQRAAEWKDTQRSEPKIARLVLRRLIRPLELYDASKPEWQMPDFIKAEAMVKTALIDGLAEIHDVASLVPASWNQIAGWLDQIDGLRRAA